MKLLHSILIGAACICCFPSPSTQAISYMDDLDAVTAENATAYTLYIGMSTKEFRTNFIGLPGWTYGGDTIMGDNARKIGDKTDIVTESISIIPDHQSIQAFTVNFRTDSQERAAQMYDRAYTRLHGRLGQAVEFTGTYPLALNDAYKYRRNAEWSLGDNTYLFISQYEYAKENTLNDGWRFAVIIGRAHRTNRR